jgi:transcriptional regulator with XRE-family HTH domain
VNQNVGFNHILLAQLLRDARAKTGLSCIDAAHAIGISLPTLSMLERDIQRNPTLAIIQKLSGFYRIPPDVWLYIDTRQRKSLRRFRQGGGQYEAPRRRRNSAA